MSAEESDLRNGVSVGKELTSSDCATVGSVSISVSISAILVHSNASRSLKFFHDK